MISGITYMGWFHTIVGIPAILAGLYLLLRDRFIYIDKGLAKFYLITTVVTSASSLFIFRATGAFNMAHFNSVIIILAAIFAYILHKKSIFGTLFISEIPPNDLFNLSLSFPNLRISFFVKPISSLDKNSSNNSY